MFCYIAYGLVINSELRLPELIASKEKVNVRIRLGRLDYVPDPNVSFKSFQITPQEVQLFWRNACTILVRNGREIIVDPVPGVEEEKLRAMILGRALAILLHQRGFLVLHASAIEVNGKVAAFIGNKGWGKSTTSAAFHANGYNLVTDDLLVLKINDSERPIVFPGFPQFKLWPDALAALGDDPTKLNRIYSQIEKRARRVTDGFSQTPMPLKSIYVLGTGATLEIEPLQNQEAFIEMVRHSFLAEFLAATEKASLHFHQCMKLASCVALYRLKRRNSLSDLPAIVQLVEEHLNDEVRFEKAYLAPENSIF